MTRHVSVRYLLPVYVTVDLDAERLPGQHYYPDSAITRNFLADENYIRLDNKREILALLDSSVIDEAIESDEAIATPISPKDLEKALDIAEHCAWPTWSGS